MRTKTRTTLAAATLGLIAATAPAATALPAWTTNPTTIASSPKAFQPAVVNLRVGEHKRFDRVVVDIQGRRPGVRANYTERLIFPGSGRTVPLRGNRKFQLVLDPARAHNLTTGANTYKGPRLKQYNLPTLRGVAFMGDFEGQVEFGFTTDRVAPYRIFTLTDPTRVVLDFHH